MKIINRSIEDGLKAYFSGELKRRIQAKKDRISSLMDSNYNLKAVQLDRISSKTNYVADSVGGYMVGI